MLAKRVLRGGPPGAGTAGLKLPTEARAFEDPMRRTHSAHAETHRAGSPSKCKWSGSQDKKTFYTPAKTLPVSQLPS